MNFLIIGHVVHKVRNGSWYAYGPYVREMNLWITLVDRVTLLVPVDKGLQPDPIDLAYKHSSIHVVEVPSFNTLGLKQILNTVVKLPILWSTTWKEMKKADHIHLRCPGNMGLLGAMVQIFFPKKIKTAKYAGNWDRSAPKPFSYRIQQYLLSHPVLSKNMKVLVYGEWENETNNVFPFFTASYSNKDILPFFLREIAPSLPINLIFAGTLSSGKQPILSVETAHQLIKKGYKVSLDFYGEGPERSRIEEYISQNGLTKEVTLHGNVPAEVLKLAYQKAHFLIFISESEGWPKVVAEAMFWGCVPLTSAVSCVPQMLERGERGDLVQSSAKQVGDLIESYLNQPEQYHQKSRKAMEWSNQFTLERFQEEIKSLLIEG